MANLTVPQISRAMSIAQLIVPKDSYTPRGYMLQSVAFSSKDGCIIAAYKDIDQASEDYCVLRKFNLDNQYVTEWKNQLLYHCNDMTYNPVTNQLIVIPLKEGRIIRYNYDTMTQITPEVTPFPYWLSGCAYNPDTQGYIFSGMRGENNLYLYTADSTFAKNEEIQVPSDSTRGIFQNIEYHNGNVYLNYDNQIVVFNLSTKKVINTYSIDLSNPEMTASTGRKRVEAEGICHIGDGVFYVGRLSNWDDANCSNSLNIFRVDLGANPPANGYWVVSNYFPQGSYGVDLRYVFSSYFGEAARVYARSNATGLWFETSYEPYEACRNMNTKLSNAGVSWSINKS